MPNNFNPYYKNPQAWNCECMSMASIQLKPAGCIVEEIDDFDGRTYCWKESQRRSLSLLHCRVPDFLALRLGRWLDSRSHHSIHGKANGGELFLMVWLVHGP